MMNISKNSVYALLLLWLLTGCQINILVAPDRDVETTIRNEQARGGLLIYSKEADNNIFIGNERVYNVADPCGTYWRTMNGMDELIRSPALSPDGHQIVFSRYSSNEATYTLHLAPLVSLAQLSVEGTIDLGVVGEEPVWSPDGQRIAFTGKAPNTTSQRGNRDIYIMHLNDRQLQRLTNAEATDQSPTWSPDGQQIAFTSYRDDTWEIYVMDAQGMNMTRLTDNEVADFEPIWSPDGQQIAFLRSAERRHNDIYLMNTDGSNYRPLVKNDKSNSAIQWAWHSQQIAYIEDNEVIRLINVDGTAEQKLFEEISLGEQLFPNFGGGTGGYEHLVWFQPTIFSSTAFKLGQRQPDQDETAVVGAFQAQLNRGRPEFYDLLKNENCNIVFKNEEGSRDDQFMTRRLADKLDLLAALVSVEWPGQTLRVMEAWSGETDEYVQDSLHYEGRAARITVSDLDQDKLGRLAQLAVDAGLDWVWYADRSYVYVSVARADMIPSPPTAETRQPITTTTTTPSAVSVGITMYGLNGETPIYPSELPQLNYLEQEQIPAWTVTITAANLSEPLHKEQHGTSPLGFNLLPGDYHLQVSAPPYNVAEQVFTVSPLTDEPSANPTLGSYDQMVEVFLSMSFDPTRLVVFDSNLLDYETGEVVLALNRLGSGYGAPGVYGVRTDDPRRLVSQNGQQYYIDGTEHPSFSLGGTPFEGPLYFAPDLKRAVYSQNNDLWLTEVDWANTQLHNPRQVTNVGIFDSSGWRGFDLFYWHDDYLLVEGGNSGTVRVELSTGNVSETPAGWYNLEHRISPDYRLLITTADDRRVVYDLVDDYSIPLTPLTDLDEYYWLDNDRAAIKGYNGEWGLWLFDRRTSEMQFITQSEALWNAPYAGSPTGKYVFGARRVDGVVVLMNLNTGGEIELSAGVEKIEWIGPERFMFSRDNDHRDVTLEQRGSWLVDLPSNQILKISPFPYYSIVTLPAHNAVVFSANETLWRVNLDGSDLTQLPHQNRINYQKLWRLTPINTGEGNATYSTEDTSPIRGDALSLQSEDSEDNDETTSIRGDTLALHSEETIDGTPVSGDFLSFDPEDTETGSGDSLALAPTAIGGDRLSLVTSTPALADDNRQPLTTPTPDVTATPEPTQPPPGPSCANQPRGEFAALWQAHPDWFGCPFDNELTPIYGQFVEMPFEHGHLFWLKNIDQYGEIHQVIAKFGGQDEGGRGSWSIHPEHWNGEGVCPVPGPPRDGLYLPERHLAQVWCDINGLEVLGYAMASQVHEAGRGIVALQNFEHAFIFRDSDGHSRGLVYVFFRADNSYVRVGY